MAEKEKVVLVDDAKIVRLTCARNLERKGFEVESLDSAEKALPILSYEWPGILVTDIVMPGMDGMSFLEKVVEIDPDLPVILITGQGDIPLAIEAIRKGAYDLIEKPFDTEYFLDIVNRAMEKRKLVLEVRRLRSQVENQEGSRAEIVGKSPIMDKLRQIVKNAAQSNVDVLLVGETGTGKDLVASYLHEASDRRNKNFVAINCAALPETIIESELFGHEAGAFTGANQRRIGKFEYANGGTLFLDEIESMPLQLQVKLLRVLQERTIERLGSNETIPIDIRVIAATKVDLKAASAKNQFREDLYYRLNVLPIHIPPLRDRKEDIPLLFQHFVTQASLKYEQTPPSLTKNTMARLMQATWQGNVREIKNEAEKFVLGLSSNSKIFGDSSSPSVSSPSSQEATLTFKERISNFEKNLIEEELIRHKGDMKKAQKALSIPKQTLYGKVKLYSLNWKEYS